MISLDPPLEASRQNIKELTRTVVSPAATGSRTSQRRSTRFQDTQTPLGDTDVQTVLEQCLDHVYEDRGSSGWDEEGGYTFIVSLHNDASEWSSSWWLLKKHT